MRRRLLSCSAFALIAMLSACLAAQDVFVLPASSSGSPNVAVFTADPFNPVAAPINLNPNGTAGFVSAVIFAGAVNNNKFYIVSSSSGPNNPSVVAVTQNPDGSFSTPKVVASNLSGAGAAYISPDGKRLFVISGAGSLLTTIDTVNDVVVSLFQYLGGPIADMAFSLDSSKAYVLIDKNSGSLVQIINAADATPLASVSLTANGNGISVAPTGAVYVSTQNGVLQLDPATLATRFTIAVNGSPGKLYFTPDGKLGIAANLAASNVASAAVGLYVFDLNTGTLISTIPSSSFNGATIDTLFPVGNNRVFAYSHSSQALFDVQINPANVSPFPYATAGSVSGVTASNDIAAGTHAATQYLFFTSGNTVQRFDVAAGQVTGQQNLSTTPGAVVFAAAPVTNGTPATLLTFGDNQSIVPGATTAPLVVQVVDAQGRPLAGVPVTFNTSAAGVTLSNTSVVTTNQGFAVVTATAKGASTGQAQVTAIAGTLSYNFTVNIGQGPGGPSQAGCLKIISGQGQFALEQFTSTSPMVVQVTDATGAPLSNQQVTFSLASGPGTINGAGVGVGTGITQQVNVTTDTNGLASVTFQATSLLPGQASDQTQINAQGPCGTGVTFFITTVRNAPFGWPIINPIQVAAQPIIMSSGSKLKGAFQTNVSSSLGTALPDVSMFIESAPFSSTSASTTPVAAPPAMCDGGGSGFALSDTGGHISCDLVATGSPGTYTIWVNVGYFSDYGPYTLVIQAGAPAKVNILSGNKQTGNPGQQLPQALTVQVTDANGAVLTGVPLTWKVTAGTATVNNASSSTNSQGLGTALVTLGNSISPVTVEVTAGTVTAVFNLTVSAPVTAIKLVSGGNQSANLNAAFASPLVFQVVDSNGNGVPGIVVNFAVTSGSGSVSNATGTTDQSGKASVNVTAGANAGNLVVTAAAGQFSATASLTVIPPGPASLVFLNGAGFQKAISPGSIVAIQGINLVPNLQGISTPGNIVGPLPTTFQGVTVTFNGTAAPIFSASNVNGVQQVVVQVPYEVGTANSAAVTVSTTGGASTTVNVPIVPYAPGIFETTAFGPRQAVALHASDGSYVTPTNPAHHGENIIIYLTGLGQTTPATGTNQAGLANQQLANTNIYAGLNNSGVPTGPVVAAPGLVGVYTLTLTVPNNAPTGNVPLNVVEYDSANNPYYAQGSFLPIQ